MKPLLSMRNVEKSYGSVKALDGVNFEVAEGEVHALIGANGAGKSTLMRVLCGELDYEGGDIVFAGETIHPRQVRDMREKGVVMIRQELSTVPVLTVAQYLFVGREPTKGFVIDDRRMEQQAVELLEPVGAGFAPDALMGDLSMAEQQLVEIAKALSYEVRLLILDEPTTALGEHEVERVFSVIRSLKERGVSVNGFAETFEQLAEADPQTAGKCRILIETKPSEINNAYKEALEFLYEKGAVLVYGTNQNVVNQCFDAVMSAGGKYDGVSFVGYDDGEKVREWMNSDSKSPLLASISQNPYMRDPRRVLHQFDRWRAGPRFG